MKRSLIGIILVLVSVISGWAFTLSVPDDYETIQAGIIWAMDGDTVLVADGWYFGIGNRGIEYLGKDIIVKSENGPRYTIIDCEGLDRGFKFYDHVTENAVLDGFTIIHGHPPTDEREGGGIWCNTNPTIKNCLIYGCSSDNPSGTYGGGIYLKSGDVTLINCKITGNIISGGGGYGAGIYCLGRLSMINCSVTDNAIIHATGSPQGAGLYLSGDGTTVSHCTFSNNRADGDEYSWGGGIFIGSHKTHVFTNCIFYFNSPDQMYKSSSNDSVSVTYSNIEDGWAGVGNISLDPLFIGGGDYHITADSPCIDTGIDAGVDTDIDGHPRPSFDGFDMGSDEYVIEGLFLDVLLSPTFAFLGQTLDWKIGLTNLDSDPVTIDAARLDVVGPITASVGLWSGFLTMDTGDYLETWLGLTIPPDALLGTYTFTTVASFQGRDLASDSFDCEITD